VFGRVRVRDAAPQFWIWTVVLFAAFGVVYWHYSERQLLSQKSAVMARQRAIASGMGSLVTPLRDKIEAWTLELAGTWSEPIVAKELSLETLSRSKGLYLRLLQKDATTPEQVRSSVEQSVHDGFTSCLFIGDPAVNPELGTPCYTPANCPAGQLCNEWNVCSPPTQPFNLRLMYRALRVLSTAWTDELHQASGDYQVRLFERDLDKVSKTDVPIAIELVTNAKYLTVLLDETPKDGIPPAPAEEHDAKEPAQDTFEQAEAVRVQGVDHTVRVGVWDVERGQLLYRARERAFAKVLPLGGHRTPLSPRTQRAQQRQVNNCSIAEGMRERVAATNKRLVVPSASPETPSE
jgi:hypothetical protein